MDAVFGESKVDFTIKTQWRLSGFAITPILEKERFGHSYQLAELCQKGSGLFPLQYCTDPVTKKTKRSCER